MTKFWHVGKQPKAGRLRIILDNYGIAGTALTCHISDCKLIIIYAKMPFN